MFRSNQIFYLVLAHIALIVASNYWVQYSFILFGFHTTWGAFSYPLIFILTDLTTRLLGQRTARQVVYRAMLPGLICSYILSNWAQEKALLAYNPIALRIALASFCAYVIGQLVDIGIFQKLRQQQRWWVAPSISTVFGNFLDTYSFFFIAFYHSQNGLLSEHWLEIASVDLFFKLLISLLTFIPLYGFILKLILQPGGDSAKAH